MQEVTKESLLALTKADLQAQYKDYLKVDAPAAMVKDDLANAILEAIAAENKGENNPPPPPPPPPAPAVKTKQPAKKDTDNVLSLEMSPDSEYANGEYRETTMNKRSYDLLPPHKYGWKVKKPS